MFKRDAIKSLNLWKEKGNRKPLILRGARQVGKTTLIDIFSKSFDQYLYFNLDKKEEKSLFEESNSFNELLTSLFLYKNMSRTKPKTLIFIDEIQNSSTAISLLRYFFEEAKDLYVIAAGSLLESLLDNNFSFPVGRVEYLSIRPCSFSEFLEAAGDTEAKKVLNQIPFPEYAHTILFNKFREFLLIGGMPEIVAIYIENKDIVMLSNIYESLLTSYLDDVEKYSGNQNMTNIIRHTIQHSFTSASERIKFQNFGQSDYRSREVGEAFRLLEKTLILQLVYPITSTKLPAMPNLKKAPKLQLLDTGLVNYFAGLQNKIFNSKQITDVYEGRVAEHYVGQELMAINPSPLFKLNFWVRENKDANAEVDFVLMMDGLLIPIEVKSGGSGRLRSLHQFIDRAPHPYAVRVYSGKLSVDNEKTIAGTKYLLLNLPFYLLGKLKEYLNWFIENHKLQNNGQTST